MTEGQSAQATETTFDAWRLVVPEPWRVVPMVGVHTELNGTTLSVVFGEEALAEGQTLASYVEDEQVLVNAVVAVHEESVVERVQLAGRDTQTGDVRQPEEVMKVECRVSAGAGTQLQSVQLFSRVGQRVALVTCVVANAELGTVRQHFDALLQLASIRCCNDTDQEFSTSCPSLISPSG